MGYARGTKLFVEVWALVMTWSSIRFDLFECGFLRDFWGSEWSLCLGLLCISRCCGVVNCCFLLFEIQIALIYFDFKDDYRFLFISKSKYINKKRIKSDNSQHLLQS